MGSLWSIMEQGENLNKYNKWHAHCLFEEEEGLFMHDTDP